LPKDVEQVTNELAGAIPGVWNASESRYQRPEDPEEALLYDYVMQKQQHKCRSDGCLKEGYCKYGFPSHFTAVARLASKLTARCGNITARKRLTG
jgi:hypothetical protein